VGPLAAIGLLDMAEAATARRGGPSAVESIRFGVGFLATAAVAGAVLVPDVRAWLARFLSIDVGSPVHALALALFVVLFGFNATYQLATDVLSQTVANVGPLTPLDLVAQEVPLLLAGIAGVGWLLRRSSGPTLARLGVVAPRWWQVALALAAAGAFYAFSNGIELVSQALTPDLAHKVDAANQRLFGGLDNPVGILTLALAAGICEEILFRGALQPRFGIVLTSLLFSSVHTQYGLSFDTLGVFVISCGLGLLRRFFNTTTSLMCHVCYDVLVGAGISLALLPWALGAEAALLALVVFGGLRKRRPALAVRP
jgi:membrane protease YdiL (CAAX protease family)